MTAAEPDPDGSIHSGETDATKPAPAAPAGAPRPAPSEDPALASDAPAEPPAGARTAASAWAPPAPGSAAATEPPAAWSAAAQPEPSAAETAEPGVADSVPAGIVAPAASEPVAPAGVATSARGVRPIHLALGVVALLAGAALFLSGFSLGTRTAATPGTPASDAALFKPFWDVWDSITHSYVGPVDRQKLVEGAIDGMMKGLGDPYSAYMSPDDLRKAREDLGGQFEGIGATIGTTTASGTETTCPTLGPDCRMTVVAPIVDSPAERAGLLAGDVILTIDGTDVAGLTLDAAIKKVRGRKDTPVVLTIVRGSDRPKDITIVRDTIVQPQVSSRDLAGGTVRYIRLAAFSDRAAGDVVASLKEGLGKGTRSFILDLRDNPGGYVTAARTIASQFIADGPIFWEESADGHQEPTNTEPGGIATGSDVKVAVLVNRGSASASEILAGALQDTGRGSLVGETTYGKGTVQEWVDLTQDSGGFRLTIAKWLTPAKRWIHHVGLTPDVTVATGGSATTPTGDPYIDAALVKLGAGAAQRPRLLGAAASLARAA